MRVNIQQAVGQTTSNQTLEKHAIKQRNGQTGKTQVIIHTYEWWNNLWCHGTFWYINDTTGH